MSDATEPDAATRAQIRAARPDASTWLTANAGSGKTRVLTDRVARLLLNGADPARILCLTYTKAAAAEMQNRLLDRLGAWAMLDDAALGTALVALGEGRPDAAALARARRLFARAIETPGGLKIQTIHAFCAGLLRRFPLEAGVPHQFTEMDERAARLLAADILEDMATGPDRPALDALAGIVTEDRLDKLTAAIIHHAADFDAARARDVLLAALHLPAGFTPHALLAEVFLGDEAETIAAMAAACASGGPTDSKLSAVLSGLRAPYGLGDLALLEWQMLTGAKAQEPFTAKLGKVPTGPLQKTLPGDLLARWNALILRVEAARPRRLALAMVERSRVLHRFARAFLARYRAAKMARGALDFDDLITRAGRLLSDPSVAQWVLFRLDGGIDHVLVDEAQDTSPGQWQVIDRLTGEFTAGEGARRIPPTLFVVGDPKQSIFSFQGADLAEFDRRRAAFAAAFAQAGMAMQGGTLAHSFRSSPAVLAVVDATFGAPYHQGLGDPPAHIAFHADRPGRVDLWPPVEGDSAEKIEDFDAPVDHKAPDRPAVRLARAIAARLRAMIDGGECIPTGKGPRPITEGDILILVRRRSDLFGALIAACKAAGLAVAGADRLKLAAELAVRDIRATLAFLATPDDDLSLAEALRSPLFGLTEGALFALAHARPGSLWQALEATDLPARAVLADLRDQSDFLRPHEVIDRLLTRHRGRERLLARLGAEAEDGIDVLLAQALAYERAEVPSLTGFLVWLDADAVQVKRRLDAAGGAIRVMTVHGAKGLEAPVVILPDTARPARERQPGPLLTPEGRPTLWRGPKADLPPALDDALENEARAGSEEDARLLYVAMTRAESWLIVAAAGKTDAPCWYDDARRGITAAGADVIEGEAPDLPGPVLRHAQGDWPAAQCVAPPAAPLAEAPLPGWLHTAPDPVPTLPRPVTATGLGGAKVLARPATEGEEPGSSDLPGAGAELAQALAAGTALHRLLDVLPEADPADWPALAGRIPDATPADLARAAAILSRGDLDLPGATVLREVALTAPPPWPGAGPFHGSIDRLSVTPDRLRIVDFKSNALVPARAEDVPRGILRQMGAYHWAAGLIWPGRAVELAILWTADGTLMDLPPALAARAFAAAAPRPPLP